MNPFRLISFATADELARAVAGAWLDEIESSRRAGTSPCCVALSGGRIAQTFFALAIEEAKESNRPLYLLFVREQPALAEGDRKRKWHQDPEAMEMEKAMEVSRCGGFKE